MLENISTETEKALVQYGGFGCLVTDASSNVNNESVVNYLLDPVMIGDSMLNAHRNCAETALFDSVSCGIIITEENQDNIDNKKEQLF